MRLIYAEVSDPSGRLDGMIGGVNSDGTMTGLPRIPEDMKFFREYTRGTPDAPKTLIVGRKTWDTLPAAMRVDKCRKYIVLTRNSAAGYSHQNAMFMSIDDALSGQLDELLGADSIIIGGAEIYAMTLKSGLVTEIRRTVVARAVIADETANGINDGDIVRFPAEARDIIVGDFELVSMRGGDTPGLLFEHYVRKGV